MSVRQLAAARRSNPAALLFLTAMDRRMRSTAPVTGEPSSRHHLIEVSSGTVASQPVINLTAPPAVNREARGHLEQKEQDERRTPRIGSEAAASVQVTPAAGVGAGDKGSWLCQMRRTAM
jgi:hypothetical protein